MMGGILRKYGYFLFLWMEEGKEEEVGRRGERVGKGKGERDEREVKGGSEERKFLVL